MRHFEMCEFAYFTLCEPARNVTRTQYFTAFIEHKHWIKVITCLSLSIGVRAGGAREAAAPPNFGQPRFFGQQEKI